MRHKIHAVRDGSIAQELGIVPGDELVSLGGNSIVDWIDYQAFSCEEDIQMVIRRGGEEIEFDFEKDPYEPLGLVFGSTLMSKERECVNHCMFCFVDQLPAGTRKTLHVKDDDWRQSLMMGNFVTLTNVSDRELQRIIARRACPLYISVHATDPDLRSRLLGTPRGAVIMDQLRALANAGLTFHTQAVICPEINDGAALEKTIADLSELIPSALSLALVPVGLTAHREGLTPLTPFNARYARDVIGIARRWQRRLKEEKGTCFVFPADEMYLMAQQDFPPDEDYEGYPQIENGIGLCRLLETQFSDACRANLPARPKRCAIACGTSVAPFLKDMLAAHPIDGVICSVHPLTNTFFGSTVTVSGLLTGGDIAAQMAGVPCDRILLTDAALREGEDVFLDGTKLSDLEARLGKPIVPVRDGYELYRVLCE